ncbi:MAG: 16S rRNA (cytosine(967)-C(5))-methyltransferase RsmB [Deltaproteobacteria bacterium]|nr:16S rRNA (cytosine(967)-C(5))-methyltransferase RsmB [Deltaproteobacteria bacterium]
MKKEMPRDLALSVLNRLPDRATPSGTHLEEALHSRSDFDERDRAFIGHLVQGVLRWRLRLDWDIGRVSSLPVAKIDPPVLNILRLALYQISFMDRVPESAAVDQAVNQAKSRGRHIGSFVNGVLRNLCRWKQEISLPDKTADLVLYLSIRHSYPEWLVRKWVAERGPEFTEELLSAGNRVPGLTLRVNSLKTDRSTLIDRLTEEGVAAKPTSYSPSGVLVEGFRGRINRLRSYREGLFQVQDEAAQVPSWLLDPKPGDRVLDVCAGLGGKTTHLAERSEDRARIVSLDIRFRRLLSLARNSLRLGLANVSPVAANAAAGLSGVFRCEFDRILVDAPCSGLGVVSRHPDIKWNRKEEDLPRLASMQRAILTESVSLLRRGGKMLYVTCTLSREENEGVVRSFLGDRREMVLENLKDSAPGWAVDLIDTQGFYRTFPHVHHMDGFFGAMFVKN